MVRVVRPFEQPRPVSPETGELLLGIIRDMFGRYSGEEILAVVDEVLAGRPPIYPEAKDKAGG